MENKTTLYQQGVHGVNVWSIWSEGNVINIQANGQSYSETVEEGKGGRSLQEQVRLRVNARVNSKLDGGFVRSMDDLKRYKCNQLGLPLPMLAKPYKDCKHRVRVDSCFFQPKLNGHRCIVTKIGDKLVAYSRRGKWVTVIDHILERLEWLPEGYFLDGELYKHGVSLQTIASLVKRDTPLAETKTIEYYIYDVFHLNKLHADYMTRLSWLRERVRDDGIIFMTPTFHMSDHEDKVTDIRDEWMERGFEGIILRPSDGKYGIDIRDHRLIKVKKRFDAEFRCVDVIPTREGWGNLILETDKGVSFKATAPGTISEKIDALKNPHKFIGKMVTCEYAEWTKEGKPFHCCAIGVRVDI